MRTLLLIFSACVFFSLETNAKPLAITDSADSYNIYPYVSDYIDKSTHKTINQIRQEDDNFRQINASSINLGYFDAKYWIRFEIENTTNEKQSINIVVKNAILNYVDFFEFKNDTLSKTVFTGEKVLFEKRDIANRNFVFNITLAPGEKSCCYISVFNSGDTISLPISVEKETKFFTSQISEYLFLGIFYGILFFLLIFCLLYFIELGDRIYNYYMLYVFFLMLVSSCYQGLHQQYLFKDMHWWNDHAIIIHIHIAYLFNILFTRGYLQLKKRNPTLYKITDVLIIVFIPSLFLSCLPVPYFVYSIIIISSAFYVSFFVLFYFSLKLYFQKVHFALYSGLANLVMFFGLTFQLCIDYGFFPNTGFNSYATHITILIESLILFLAILNRFKRQQVEAQEILSKKNSEILQQKEQLERANVELEKLSIVARKTDSSVAIFNRFGDLEWLNYGFEKIHGYNQEQLVAEIGNEIYKIYPNTDLPRLLTHCVLLKETVIFDTKQVTRFGAEIWVNTTLTPHVNNRNEVVKLIAIDSDITELKQTQHELILARDKAEEANRIKTTFLSNISHEIRTPLNAIIGFSDLIITRKQALDKQDVFIRVVNKNGKHLLNVISDIIDISKLEAGHIDFFSTTFSTITMLHELDNEYKYTLQNKDHIPRLKNILIDESDALIYTDKLKLKQILSNLLNNAYKFTDKGSIEITLNLVTELEEKFYQFSVKDTGIGISDEQQKRIYDRFRQADETISRDYGGTGLGLPISRGLIELMGGRIWLESELGKGSVFHFTLPHSPAHMEQFKDNNLSVENLDLHDKTILLVEYQEDVISFFKNYLRVTDALIQVARKGSDAFSIIDANTPNIDLILIDLNLPMENGYSIAAKILKKNPKQKIIAIAGYIKPEIRYRCLQTGFVDYLAKPINPRVLVLALKKFLLDGGGEENQFDLL